MKEKSLRGEILAYAKEKYHSEAEYLWESSPDAAVLRHGDNRKWYALIMKVERARLGLSGEGETDILNVKCGSDMALLLRGMDGFLPAYHMNKTKWISVLLDKTVGKDMVLDLIDTSFVLTAPKKSDKKSRESTKKIRKEVKGQKQ
ncbi:MAG: MmcQ/YjbR family DNA-binding protein [Lachnospiraceae bacterium]|nr:MmcQ/YjbR family DNA-binding protein [Lachnospiraceae bacterium]